MVLRRSLWVCECEYKRVRFDVLMCRYVYVHTIREVQLCWLIRNRLWQGGRRRAKTWETTKRRITSMTGNLRAFCSGRLTICGNPLFSAPLPAAPSHRVMETRTRRARPREAFVVGRPLSRRHLCTGKGSPRMVPLASVGQSRGKEIRMASWRGATSSSSLLRATDGRPDR